MAWNGSQGSRPGATQWLLLVAVLLGAMGCPATPPPHPSPSVGACSQADPAACERAILAAEGPELAKLLATYAAGTGQAGWPEMYRTLSASPERPALVHQGVAPAVPKSIDRIALPAAPQTVAPEALALAIARAAGRRHLFFATSSGIHQLFPQDVLEVHTLGLMPTLLADPGRLGEQVALAASLHSAISAAQRFDYVSAATEAEHLRVLADASPPEAETTLRARYGLWLLSGAGLTLARDDDGARTPPT